MALAAIASSAIGAIGAKSAARTAVKGQREAQGISKEQLEKTEAALKPWSEAGTSAIQRLDNIFSGDSADYSDFYKSPGYDFTLSEGMKGIENRASIGSLLSGRTLKGLTRFGQDHANKYFGNYVGNLKYLASEGRNAVTAAGQLGANAANAMAGNAANVGQANASGTLGMTNAIQGGLSNLAYFYNARPPQTYNQQSNNFYNPVGVTNAPNSTYSDLPVYGQRYA